MLTRGTLKTRKKVTTLTISNTTEISQLISCSKKRSMNFQNNLRDKICLSKGLQLKMTYLRSKWQRRQQIKIITSSIQTINMELSFRVYKNDLRTSLKLCKMKLFLRRNGVLVLLLLSIQGSLTEETPRSTKNE